MSTFEIVPLTAAELDAVAQLESVCFADPWTRAQLAEELDNPQAVVRVAKLDGVVAGYAGMHCVLDEAYITNVAVFPQFRRLGTARALMDALIAHCRAQSMAFLTLEVRASNTAAITLYRSCGLAPVGTRRGFYAHPTEDALLMTRFFSDNSKSLPCRA